MMKLKERVVWIVAVIVLSISAAVLWAALQVNEQVWGNGQYLNYMDRLRVQQMLEEGDLDAAAARNREWLSMWLNSFRLQEQLGHLLISDEQFKYIGREAEGLGLDLTSPEQ